ncbi:uncharacterized protein [Rutidosis leptorrhynchoides]|uniref:uncharacterized protein n=1 Tax=Rutidosis leptorrhynchoides TaxID=125765 RepID=UPI003A9933EE
MDKWMVAVAAGAGYISQHFKKIKQADGSVKTESSIDGSSRVVEPESPNQPSDKKCPFRRLSRKESMKKDDFEGKSETSTSDLDVEKGMNIGTYEGSGVFSSSSLFSGFIGGDGVSEGIVELPNKPLKNTSRVSIRRRRKFGVAVRPLSSLESCVMAQLQTEHVEMKRSKQTVRPFVVTDGSNVINRSSDDSFVVPNNVVEKKLQTRSEEKVGLSDATLFVCLGMSFGILYSFMANKLEVEKLNRLLKQKENLVQDLEEELEMKDSLLMQELTIDDDHKLEKVNGYSFNHGSPFSASNEHDNEESVVMTIKDDSFKEIEAELEAELEMLEQNMTSSAVQRKISNLVEIDPDFELGVSQGELRADMLDWQANTNKDESGSTSTTHSANYAVSPRELSLRLHEVLQSQLEERIRELEAELESKQTQNHKSWKELSSSDAGDEYHIDEPVVLNLSGEALDAYNEACNEFAKFEESDEEIVERTPVYKRDDDWLRYGGGTSEDDKDFDEDEMEKMLIKHIVEKARKGSPAILNAQRVLFSE